MKVLVICQSCFDETQMFCWILEANGIQKEINAVKRRSASYWSNYRLSNCCRILTNVRVVNIHVGT